MIQYRGSRLHALEWTEQPSFTEDLANLVAPVPVILSPSDPYLPRGRAAPREARLESFGPTSLPGLIEWPRLRAWWLRHAAGANTPNWDIAIACSIEGNRGLILVEAKANKPELSRAGKILASRRDPSRPRRPPSQRSIENHEQIAAAIAMANEGLAALDPGINLSRDSHYQLCNRIAFGWWLASHGLPTIILYVGFLGDHGIPDAGPPFSDDHDWQTCFEEYCRGVVPSTLRETRLNLGSTPLWVLARSRTVLSQSPPLGAT